MIKYADTVLDAWKNIIQKALAFMKKVLGLNPFVYFLLELLVCFLQASSSFIYQLFKFVLLTWKFIFGCFPVCDIKNDTLVMSDFAFWVKDGHGSVLDPPYIARLSD